MGNSIDIDRDITIVDISELNEQNNLAAAYLVMESLPAYYEVEGIDKAEMAHSVVELIGKPGSETEKGFAALIDNKMVGIATYLSANKLSVAQLVGVQVLLKQLSSGSARIFREHLRSYDTDIEIPIDESIYLARFAVEKSFRGLGLAGKLMDELLSLNHESGGAGHYSVSLHVAQGNQRAIAFYQKHGFDLVSTEKRYLTMVCSQNKS